MMRSESPASHVIDRCGGVAETSRLLGHAFPSTVQGWKARGFIPARRQPEVLVRAREAGIPLQPEDFFRHTAAEPLLGSVDGTGESAARAQA